MSLDVTQLELGPFPVNCYVVRHSGAGGAVVVDPGWPGEEERILGALDGAAFARAYVDVPVRPYTPDVLLQGEERLELAGIAFETLRVPGHTADHLAFAAEGCLFSGDVLFAGSVGRTDRPGDDWESLVASIRMLVERFPPETVVYPGHGPATTLGAELAANPFLAELRAAHR